MSKCVGYVDGETEFFNGTIWKPISEYQKGEKVLQYHKGGKADLVEPLEFFHEKTDEPFYECMGGDYIETSRPANAFGNFVGNSMGYAGCFTLGLQVPYYNRKQNIVSKAWGDIYFNSKQSAGGCSLIMSCKVEEIVSRRGCTNRKSKRKFYKDYEDYELGKRIAEKLYNLTETGSFDDLDIYKKVHLCERGLEALARCLSFNRMCEVPEYLKEFLIESDDYSIEGIFNGVSIKTEWMYTMTYSDWVGIEASLRDYETYPYHASRCGDGKGRCMCGNFNVHSTYSLKDAYTLVTRLNMTRLYGSKNLTEVGIGAPQFIARKELSPCNYAYLVVSGRYTQKSLGDPVKPYFQDWELKAVHKEDKYNFTVPSHGLVLRRKGILFVVCDSTGKAIE